ncbi:hypothetical protein ABZY90_21460 [Streptomyces sp. NPDC006422]|uniref:COG1470 family protein n=1 Tax=unclassified Streptomyces TaxID=2593676 RepID=UPI00339FA97A
MRASMGGLLAAAVALVLSGLCAPASSAAPGWTVAPSSAGGTRPAGDDGRPYVYAEGAPGDVLEDKVAVSNPGGKAITVSLRGADGDGERKESKDTGAWIRFAEASVKVPARTRAEVPFTVTVPASATPGDHPGAIVARSGGRDAGVSVHLRVSGPTLSALTVENVRVAEDTIAYDVVNRGNTTLSPRLALTADGVLGASLDRRRELPVRIAPGRKVALKEPWRDAPALDEVDVKVTVTAGGGAADTATASARFVPWGAVGGGLAVLAGAACAAYWYLRRRPVPRPLRMPRRQGNVRSAP